MHDFMDDTNLLFELLVGIVVICINDAGRIEQFTFIVFLKKKDKIFIVIIRDTVTMLIDCPTQNGVRKRISVSLVFS